MENSKVTYRLLPHYELQTQLGEIFFWEAFSQDMYKTFLKGKILKRNGKFCVKMKAGENKNAPSKTDFNQMWPKK